jgi:putative peptidoglycan lipid II flippase
MTAESSAVDSQGRIGRNTAVMAVGTTLSRVTGVIRIFAITYALGSLSLADAYNLANTIPNIVHDIVLGGIVSATFIPVFVERLSTRTDEEAWDAISAVTSVTLLVIGAATVLFFVVTPFVIDVTTSLNNSSGAAQTRHVATDLLLLFVPQLTCYGLVSLGTALLNARRSFAAPMFTPVANNLVLILVLLLFAAYTHQRTVGAVSGNRGDVLLLGLGTTFGVVAQAALMVPSLRKAGLRLRWLPDFRHDAVRTILRLSGWTFGLVVANQIALTVVLVMSQKVGAGAVSAYTYSYTFFQLPYGVVAVSLMSATAPELASLWSVGNIEGFRRRMALVSRGMLAIIVPAAAGLLVLARPLVALILAHGATSVSQTVPTASALAMLALGLPGFCIFLYAIRVLQSIQDLRSAFWLYVLENGVNIVFAVALAGPLGVRGIALSISIAYTLAAVVAVARVRDRVGGLGARWMARPLGRVAVSSAVMILVTALASNVSAAQRGFGLLGRVLLGVVAGLVSYFLTAGALAAVTSRRGPRGPSGGPGSHAGPGGPFFPRRSRPGGAPGHGELIGRASEWSEVDREGAAREERSDGSRALARGGEPAGADGDSAEALPRGPFGNELLPLRRRRGAHSASSSRWRMGGLFARRQRVASPSPPEPLPPAGRPPRRPSGLGPLRRRDPGREDPG